MKILHFSNVAQKVLIQSNSGQLFAWIQCQLELERWAIGNGLGIIPKGDTKTYTKTYEDRPPPPHTHTIESKEKEKQHSRMQGKW